MAGKRSSPSDEAYHGRYKTAQLWKVNRTKRLQRELKRNPNNAQQINAALGNMVYRRRTPTTRQWNATKRRIAELFKMFQGRVPKNALHASNETGEKYWAELNASKPGFLVPTQKFTGSMFALGARVNLGR